MSRVISVMACMAFMQGIHAQTMTGLVGGNDGSGNLYVAYLEQENATQINLDIPDAYFNGSSLSSDGSIGIVGGQDDASTTPYAYVIANGSATQVDLGFSGSGSAILSTAIDVAGAKMIIGGENNGNPYAAYVSPEAVPTVIDIGLTDGSINSVSINETDTCLFGGVASSAAYAAIVSGGSTTPTEITLGEAGGYIASVAINNSGNGIIGGQDAVGKFYGVAVSGSTPTPIDFGDIEGYINSVAINNSGLAFVGGNLDGDPSLFSIVGLTPTAITVPFSGGSVQTIAINSSGMGIMGGIDGSGHAHIYFISPEGSLTTIDAIPEGSVIQVVINDAGVGLIAGNDASSNGVALIVSPSNVVIDTNISLAGGDILCAAISNASYVFNSVTPAAVGAYGSTLNTQLAASYALESHMLTNHKPSMWNTAQKKGNNIASADLLADANDRVMVQSPTCKTPPYTLWFAPFNDYVNQSAQGSVPSVTNEIAGFIGALDCRKNAHVFGGGVAYAFNYAKYGQSLGHATINQEMLFLFESYQNGSFFINGAVWGGYYQASNTRHAGFGITSKANFHGWQCTPHLEMSGFAYRNPTNWFILEPFGMFDWVNNWQNSFTESGASGFNVVMPSIYSSLLRSEAGLRFYELLSYGWGQITLEEKLSYINQAPFGSQSASTFFVGSISSFSVVTGSSTVQNLAGLEMHVEFVPCDAKYPYGILDFQGEFGSSYQSYFVGAEIGKRF